MVAALVSACAGRVVRDDLAMTGEITLTGQVLPVGGIKEKVLAAHRYGLARIILPRQDQMRIDEDLGDDFRRTVAVDYVTCIDEVLDLALERALAADDVAAVCSTGRPSARKPLRRLPPVDVDNARHLTDRLRARFIRCAS